jgi:hypothetical protein
VNVNTKLRTIAAGAVLGTVVVLASLVVVTAASVFVALSQERDAGVEGVLSVDYTAAADGGFDLSLATGPGTVAVLVAGAVAGAALALGRPRRTPEALS